MAFAKVVNEELKQLFAAEADVVQLDEFWMQATTGSSKTLRCEGCKSGARRGDRSDRPSYVFRFTLTL